MQPLLRGRKTYHGRHALHDNENDAAEDEEHGEHSNNVKGAADARGRERRPDRHAPQHGGQLLMGKRQSPETEVRGRVRHAVEAELCPSC